MNNVAAEMEHLHKTQVKSSSERRVRGNGAPWHALIELPPEMAGVQGNLLRGERLT